MIEVLEATGYFWYTYEAALIAAKSYSTMVKGSAFYGMYCSVVKGKPDDPNRPEECWAITNRYDPRVKHVNRTTS